MTDPAPSTSTEPRSSRDAAFSWLVGACVALGFVVVMVAEGKPVFPLDDAYITLHNALALRHQLDVSFMHSSPLEGSTSLVHLALATLVQSLTSAPRGLQALSVLGVLLYVAGLVRLARTQGATHLQGLAFAVGTTLCGNFLVHLGNGLETSLALAAFVWTIALTREDTSSTGRAVPVLLGVIPFVRPELGLLSALMLVYRIIERRAHGPVSTQRNALLRDIVFAALSAAPWLAVNLIALGTPWPSSIAAKRAFFAVGCHPALDRARVVGVALAVFAVRVGPVVAGALFLARSRLARTVGVFVALFVIAYWAGLPIGLMHNEQRYTHLLVPALAVGLALSFDDASPHVSRAARWITVAMVLFNVAMLPRHLEARRAAVAITRRELVGVSQWLRRNVAPSAVLLVHDVGYLSVTTPFTLIDLVGLKRHASVVAHQRLTYPSCGDRRGEAVAHIAMRTRPTHLVVSGEWDHVFKLSDGLRRAGYTLTLLRDSPRGFKVYALSR